LFTKQKQHVIEIIYGRGKFVGDFNMEGVSLLEILIWVHYKGMWIENLRICPIRIEIIYGRGKFVGDFDMGNIICVKILPYRSG
jgi:hypothetical protein